MEETTIAYHQIIGGTATLAPEGIEANYRDMLNYGVFALIRLNHLD